MNYIILGLGNPGSEYEGTRHNAGRMIVDIVNDSLGGEEFQLEKISKSLKTEIKIGTKKVTFLKPETFMNKSGDAIKKYIKNIKDAEKLLVVYDDFQLPLGRVKVSYNKSSGGHRGLESIIKALKTEAFARLRIGTAPSDKKGNAKIPHGEDKIEKFILGKFKPEEIKVLKKIGKDAVQTVELFVLEGREKATGFCNSL